MKTTIETITPEIAKEYLKRNFNNRPLRDKDVSFLLKSNKIWAYGGSLGKAFHLTNK